MVPTMNTVMTQTEMEQSEREIKIGSPRSDVASDSTASGRQECDSSDNDSSNSGRASQRSPHEPHGGARRRWASFDSEDDEFELESLPRRPDRIQLLLEPAVPAPTTPLRSKLSSEAKCWVPRKEVSNIDCLSTHEKLQFAEVVAAGLRTLRVLPTVREAAIREASCGWSVIAKVGRQVPPHNFNFASVQKEILAAAERSGNVYVVGYMAQPFANTSNGFKIKLTFVPDNEDTCWDLVSGGWCPRGCRCKWRHPAHQVEVDFHAAISDW